MNTTTQLGNLTRAPEVRTLTSGLTVVSATIAVNRKKRDGSVAVAFIDLTLWDKTGENFAKFHKQGDRVLVHGRIDQDTWSDKDTGAKRSKLFITVDSWSFVKRDGQENF